MFRVLVLAATLALILVTASQADDEQNATAEKVKKLQTQWRDVLKTALDGRKLEFQTRRGSYEAVYEAAKKLLVAELDLATTPEQRVAAHAARLELANDMEERMAAREKAGFASPTDVLDARADRLEAEIAWLKAGGKEEKKEKK